MAIRSLGLAAELEQIDEELGFRNDVSLADLRSVFERRDLRCRCVLLTSANGSVVASAIRECSGVAVAALDSEIVGIKHFAPVKVGDGNRLLVIDVTKADIYEMPFKGDALINGIPVLIVGKDVPGGTTLRGMSGQLARIVVDGLSSRLVTGGLFTVVGLLICSTLASRSFRSNAVMQAAVNLIRLLLRQATRPLLLISLALTAISLFLLVRELNPLAADTFDFNLGRVPVGSEQVMSFRVFNRSLFRTRRLKSVKGSCACLKLDVKGEEIPPGGAATVTVSLMAAKEGTAQHAIAVTPSGGFPTMQVNIRMDGYETTKFEPMNFNLGAFPQGISLEKTFTLKVRDYEGAPVGLKARSAASESPMLEVSLEDDAVLAREGTVTLRIVSTNQPLGIAAFSERISLSTIEAKPRTFILTVHGAFVQPVAIEPRAVFLKSTPDGERLFGTLTLRSRSDRLEVTSVVANRDVAGLNVSSDAINEQELRIQVESTGQDFGDTPVYIRVSIRRPVDEEIEIPVYSSPSVEDS